MFTSWPTFTAPLDITACPRVEILDCDHPLLELLSLSCIPLLGLQKQALAYLVVRHERRHVDEVVDGRADGLADVVEQVGNQEPCLRKCSSKILNRL